MKILISHSRGNENTRNVVYGLYNANLLYSYIVSVAVYRCDWFYRFLHFKPFAIFLRRELPSYLKKRTTTFPYMELCCQISNKLRLKWLTKFESSLYSFYSVSQYIDKKSSRFLRKHSNEIDAVYCFEDEALNTFGEARALGKICIYDLPIGYWRSLHQLLGAEKDINPQWAVTMGGLNDSKTKLEKKDKELGLADYIFVASSFTKKSLSLFPGKLPSIYVVPYGFPPVNDNRSYPSLDKRKIKLLYVGSLTQRKGISYMFDAVKGLENDYELTIVGGGDLDECRVLKESLQHYHYFPSLPHDKILKLMSESDIFLFPSLFEGFGLVITEAMSQGTPVITTERTCGPDVITNGEDGWIVNAGDSMAIRRLLENLKDDKELIIQVGKNARERARRWPWNAYQEEMVKTINHAFKDYSAKWK